MRNELKQLLYGIMVMIVCVVFFMALFTISLYIFDTVINNYNWYTPIIAFITILLCVFAMKLLPSDNSDIEYLKYRVTILENEKNTN